MSGSFSGSRGLVACLCALFTGNMLWICLSDPAVSAGFWPTDIQRVILGWSGGTIRQDAAGNSRIDLSWLAVLIRSIVVVAVVVAFGWIAGRVHRPEVAPALPSAKTDHPSIWSIPLMPSGCFAAGWMVAWFVVSSFPESAAFRWMVQTAPLWLSLACGLLLTGAWLTLAPLARSKSAGDFRRPQWPLAVVAVSTLLWVVVSFWMNERLYAGLWIPHGDSAMYEEHLWNLRHGKGFRSYLDQGLFLGEHIQFIHVFLLPFHWLWPSHLLLELAESVALGFCVVPIYRMTLRATSDSRCAAALCMVWLCYVPMHFLDIAIDFKSLRPINFGLPFLLLGLDSAEQRRLGRAEACFLIAMTAKEDFALVIAPIGLVLAWEFSQTKLAEDRKRMRWAVGVAVITLAYLLLTVLVLIPWFRDGEPVHYSRYFGDLGSSPSDLMRTTLTEPWKVARQVFSFRTLTYGITLLIPLAGLPLWNASRLAAAIPAFLMLSLIQLTQPGAAEGAFPPVPYHHFHAPLLPVLFWAAAGGLGRLSEPVTDRRQWCRPAALRMAGLAFVVSLFVASFSSMMPLGVGFWSATSPFGYSYRFQPQERALSFAAVQDLLPMNARIASTDYVHTRLTHCDRSYDYSDYLRAVNNYQPGVPPDTDYIVIDTQHPYSRIRQLDQVPELQEDGLWQVVPHAAEEYFIVLKRRAAERDSEDSGKDSAE